MLAMIKKQLVQAGILLGALGIVMVLGGIFEGSLGLLTALGALAVLAALLYGLICVLDAYGRPAECVNRARTAQQGSARTIRQSESLQVA